MTMYIRSVVLTALLVLLPLHAHAYRVPEREYWRTYVLSLINQSRSKASLPPVGLDEKLTGVSQLHAEDTATHFDDTNEQTRRATYLIHVSSDHRTLRTRLMDAGLLDSVSSAGENVGFRTRGPIGDIHAMIREAIDLLHTGMMAELPPDDGHRKTILGDFTHVGVGLEFHRSLDEKTNTLFFVTNFAKFNAQKPVIIPELGKAPAPLSTGTMTEERPDAPTPVVRRTRERPIAFTGRRGIIRKTIPAPKTLTEKRTPQKVSVLRVQRLHELSAQRRLARLLQRTR